MGDETNKEICSFQNGRDAVKTWYVEWVIINTNALLFCDKTVFKVNWRQSIYILYAHFKVIAFLEEFLSSMYLDLYESIRMKFNCLKVRNISLHFFSNFIFIVILRSFLSLNKEALSYVYNILIKFMLIIFIKCILYLSNIECLTVVFNKITISTIPLGIY